MIHGGETEEIDLGDLGLGEFEVPEDLKAPSEVKRRILEEALRPDFEDGTRLVDVGIIVEIDPPADLRAKVLAAVAKETR